MPTNIYVALTTHRSIVDTACAVSLAQLFYYLAAKKIATKLRAADGADIANARDYQVTELIEGQGFTHILFVDSDMGFPPALVQKLIEARREVIGCAYPQRFIDGNGSPIGYVPDSIKASDFNSAAPIEVPYIGMGLCLIAKTAFEKLIATGKIATMPLHGKQCLRFFSRLTINNAVASEDISFCHRWRECGGKVYALASTEIAHIGRIEIRANLPQNAHRLSRSGDPR